MKNILVWGDSPTSTTGFARVLREIFTRLAKLVNLNISWLAINYSGDPHDYPFKIYPAQEQLVRNPDILGLRRLSKFITTLKPDTVFILNDLWIFSKVAPVLQTLKNSAKEQGHPFKLIYYFPVDGDVHKHWIDSLDVVDEIITYTHWAKRKCLEKNPNLNVRVIPHGVDTNLFKKIEVPKKPYFLFSNVGRNLQRKQIPLSILAYSRLRKIWKDVKLYLHCQPEEFGISLPLMAKNLGLSIGTEEDNDIMIPSQNFLEHKGFSDEDMVKIYNNTDCLISTTVGEGWGLPLLEASACGTLTLMPLIQPLVEIYGQYGKFYSVNGSINFERDLSIFRPVPDIEDMAKQMAIICDTNKNSTELKDKKLRAYNEAKKLDWGIVFKKYWLEVFNL